MPTDSEILRRDQMSPRFRLVPLEDWRAHLRTRSNVLVTGPRDALSSFMQSARSEMLEPIVSVAGSAPLPVDARTIILTDVDTLSVAEQRRLTEWMNEPRNWRAQIISSTSDNLFSLVQARRFDGDLFYRLNIVHLKIQDGQSAGDWMRSQR
jgi:hypothetical protein